MELAERGSRYCKVWTYFLVPPQLDRCYVLSQRLSVRRRSENVPRCTQCLVELRPRVGGCQVGKLRIHHRVPGLGEPGGDVRDPPGSRGKVMEV